jgi:lambda family phage portal protein
MSENSLVTPTDIGLPSMSGTLFRNLETSPGQVFTLPHLQSARKEGRTSRKDIVKAARHVERYSEHIRGGLDKKADYTVGPRLMAHAKPDFEALGIEDPEQQKKLQQSFEREFRNWAYDNRLLQDAEGHYDFGGLMWMAFRNLQGPDGECAGVIHYDAARARRYGTKWATYLSIIDPDRIETPPQHMGNDNVQDGKILDRDGRMVGMFVRKNHPSDVVTSPADYEIVDRESRTGRPIGFHWFVKTRASQLRGISTLVTIIKQTGMVDQFDDAYLAAAIINQMLATWIESPMPADLVMENLAPAPGSEAGAWAMFENKLDYYNKTKLRFGGARIPVMPPGDKITMSAVNRAIDDPSAFRNSFLREFASAIGISFEQLANTFGDSNYSAARAAILDAWQGILKLRYQFGQHVAALVYDAVIEEAVAKAFAELPAGAPDFYSARGAYTRVEWTGPGMPQIDPLKEANAAKILLETKLTSREEIIAQRGANYLTVFDQIGKEREEAEERGFSLDPLAPGTPTADEDQQGDEADAGGAGKAKPKKKGSSVKDGDGDGTLQEG